MKNENLDSLMIGAEHIGACTPEEARRSRKEFDELLAEAFGGRANEEEFTAGVSEGRKDDSAKLRMDLIPPEIMVALAAILTFGAAKYADRNWEKGMSWGRVFGALMRHMWAWWGGKGCTSDSFLFGELDLETGYSHLWHALACLVFLVTYESRQIGTDDRQVIVKVGDVTHG